MKYEFVEIFICLKIYLSIYLSSRRESEILDRFEKKRGEIRDLGRDRGKNERGIAMQTLHPETVHLHIRGAIHVYACTHARDDGVCARVESKLRVT